MKKHTHENISTGSFSFPGTVVGILAAVIFVISCSMEINAPASMRFSAEVTVLDTSLHDADSLVAGADVVMQSVSYGDRYESVTNSHGVALFNGLIPDSYNIMATGKRVDLSGITNINGQLQDTSL
ncbi:MAG: carboxypeptidase-like regulatory domain-containing protein [Candidatus Marinimicrobia bacterium]|nr:carboxypeptidase-like regulatory domain-containing protein [Candidatus Neomarinimicrobiota bacterium]